MMATKEPKQVRGPGNRPLSVLRETKRRSDERGGTMLRTAALIAVASAALACGSGGVQAARGAGSSAPIGLSTYGRLVWNLDALVHDRYGRAHVCMRAQRFAIHRCASSSFNDGDYRDASHVQNSRRWC